MIVKGGTEWRDKMKNLVKNKIYIILLILTVVLFVDKILNVLSVRDFILVNPSSVLSVTDGFQWNLWYLLLMKICSLNTTFGAILYVIVDVLCIDFSVIALLYLGKIKNLSGEKKTLYQLIVFLFYGFHLFLGVRETLSLDLFVAIFIGMFLLRFYHTESKKVFWTLWGIKLVLIVTTFHFLYLSFLIFDFIEVWKRKKKPILWILELLCFGVGLSLLILSGFKLQIDWNRWIGYCYLSLIPNVPILKNFELLTYIVFFVAYVWLIVVWGCSLNERSEEFWMGICSMILCFLMVLFIPMDSWFYKSETIYVYCSLAYVGIFALTAVSGTYHSLGNTYFNLRFFRYGICALLGIFCFVNVWNEEKHSFADQVYYAVSYDIDSLKEINGKNIFGYSNYELRNQPELYAEYAEKYRVVYDVDRNYQTEHTASWKRGFLRYDGMACVAEGYSVIEYYGATQLLYADFAFDKKMIGNYYLVVKINNEVVESSLIQSESFKRTYDLFEHYWGRTLFVSLIIENERHQIYDGEYKINYLYMYQHENPSLTDLRHGTILNGIWIESWKEFYTHNEGSFLMNCAADEIWIEYHILSHIDINNFHHRLRVFVGNQTVYDAALDPLKTNIHFKFQSTKPLNRVYEIRLVIDDGGLNLDAPWGIENIYVKENYNVENTEK